MIQELRIENFAIIDNLTVNFSQGLNVLTGETGAGKSIIMDALNLILGGRADTDLIRSSKDTASVQASISITNPKTAEMIHDLGMEVEDETIFIKRTVSSKGKNRTLLNNTNLTVSTLAKIGERLVDIHGQHDHQTLLYPEYHGDILDAYGNLQDQRDQYRDHFNQYQKKLQTLNQILKHQGDLLQRQDSLNFQIQEIDQASLQQDEEDLLRTEKNKMQNAEQLNDSLRNALGLLVESEGAILEQLGRVQNDLNRLIDLDPKLSSQSQRGENAYYEIEELVEELRDYERGIEFSPERLEEIDDRLAEINGLKRKYGNSVSIILEYREQIGEELKTLTQGEESLDILNKEIQEFEEELSKLAINLAKKRESIAKEFKSVVEKELKDLSMKHVQFGVRFDYPEDPSGFTIFNKTKIKAHEKGIGYSEFLFSPNPGEDLRPLAKIASGGELSRVMLALKTILNNQDLVPVMVFDEVDSGISGKVAEKVGQKLKSIANNKQVFCITHLPQIAGFANTHFRVEKKISGKRTQTVITELNMEERVEEIARMSSGENITETTLQYAREMIK